MKKPNGRGATLRAKRLAVAVAAAFLPWDQSQAQITTTQLPTGERVVHGQVDVSRSGDGTSMTINHGTLNGIVNWHSFSIPQNHSVHVNQDRSAALLNRVTGNDPSHIFGSLSGQGKFFLVNNAGVLFGPSASVSIGSLIASTLSITDQDFLAGNYRFDNPGNAGSVVNQGSIVTAGGYTALIGPKVRNDGTIVASSGQVALGAGDRVSLDLIGDGLISINVDQAAFNASVVNTGLIDASGGTVMLKASSANALLDTVINTSGVIRANSLVERNGEIVLDGAGKVQIAGVLEAGGGNIEIAADASLNIGSTVCCVVTQVVSSSQEISAGSVTIGGGASVISTPGDGTQTVSTPGTLLVRGGTVSGGVGLFHNGTGAQTITAGNLELRGGTGTNTGAFINSNAGGDQNIIVSGGTIAITGGAAGTGNRAGMVATGNQTIAGDPHIVLTGGAGGGSGNASNNVFVQATGDDTKLQKINAATITLTAGTGTDASATLNAARQVIATTGDVSLLGSAGLGGLNGARIGGIGGNVLGPTNLTLTVGGHLLLRGGTAAGVSLGSSGASTQANSIAVTAATGNITLQSDGGGARIGANASANPVNPGTINLSAGGSLTVGAGTAIRADGPIVLTAGRLVNDGVISNGGGANTGNVILSANAFDLDGGNIQAGAAVVGVRPRDGGRSFGVESEAQTTLSNADLAKINTTNFVVLGSGVANTFTGNLSIGENAQVNGSNKNLAFLRSSTASGTTTIGAHGVATGGDLIVSAGGGRIVSNGGVVQGDEVQLRATQTIGVGDARVNTAARALAIGTAGSAYVSEADDVTMRTIALNVGGNVTQNTIGTSTGGLLDLSVNGALSVSASGTQNAIVSSGGGQHISARSVNVTAQNGGVAQIVNTGPGQTITARTIDVETSTGGGLAEIRNNTNAEQKITVTGDRLAVRGMGGGSAIIVSAAGNQTIDMTGAGPKEIVVGADAALGSSTISSGGHQAIRGGADVRLTGGSGPLLNGSNAIIFAFNPSNSFQSIEAGSLTLANSTLGGNNSVAAILARNQLINTTGDVTMTANASGGDLPGVRIGGLGGGGGTGTSTNLTLNVGGDLVLTGGSVAGNGVGIGSTAAVGPAFDNNITINAPNGSVILNSGVAGSGVRIGSAASTGTAAGNISITAGGDIRLNGVQENAAIRTLDRVTLEAASISEAANGVIIANSLTTTSTVGATTLAGQNRISNYSGSSAADLFLFNRGALDVNNLRAQSATFSNDGSVTISGPWITAGQTNITAFGFGSLLSETAGGLIQANGINGLSGEGGVNLTGSNRIAGTLFGSSMQGEFKLTNTGDLNFSVFAMGGDVDLVNSGALNVASLAGRNATVTNIGPMAVSGFWTSNAATTIGTVGDLTITSSVFSNGPMNVEVDGTLTVAASGVQASPPPPAGLPPFPPAPNLATLTSFGGQDITAQAIKLLANDGAQASISNQGAGNQNIAVSGGSLDIRSAGAPVVPGTFGSFAQIGNSGSGDQTINVSGGGINVRSDGGSAQISSGFFGGPGFPATTGSQTVNVTGGPGIDIEAHAGGNAAINQNGAGAQTIAVQGGDHIRISGVSGGASIFANRGSQMVSIAGGGANAISIGAAGNLGPSVIAGGAQHIVAGTGNESGSISIAGAAAGPTFTGISSAQLIGGTQTVSTSGAVSITGGDAPNQPAFGFATGLFHNGSGEQKVSAASLEMRGGPTGANNVAIIISSGGAGTIPAGDQVIDVSGNIALAGGASGLNNTAIIVSNADQSVSAASVELQGGTGGVNNAATLNIAGAGGNQSVTLTGDLAIAGGAGGNAGILGSANLQQTISARNITLTNSATGGNNSVGFILGGHQSINARGDLTMTARASGGELPGVRIGGLSGNTVSSFPGTGTDLDLVDGGNVLLTGGTALNNGVGIGSTAASGAPAFRNDITINAGGSVVLNSGTLAGTAARIGSPAAATGPGDISIIAGGGIELNGVSQGTAIRTAGMVTLQADHITEAANGFIVAGTLNTKTLGDTMLTGPNRVGAFNATSGGDVNLSNTGELNVTGLIAAGDANISNIGDVTVSGVWDVDGTSTITVHSDIVISGAMTSPTVVLNATDGSIVETSTGSIAADTLTTFSLAETDLGGANNVALLNSTSTGGLTFNNTAASFTLGEIQTNGGAFDLNQTGDMTLTHAQAYRALNWVVGGSLALLGGSTAGAAVEVSSEQPMTIAVGGNLLLRGGSGDGAFAKILGYSDINLAVGGFLTMQAGTGKDAYARVQTTSRDSVIFLTFPNLASGGFTINGYTDIYRDGKSGFLSENGVAAPSHQLILDYGGQ